MRRPRAAAALAGALLACGCASPPIDGEPPGFWQRRQAELMRSFDAELLVGPGLGARVTATHWLQAGALTVGSAEADSAVLPVPEHAVGLRAGALRSEVLRGHEYGLSPWYRSDYRILAGGGTTAWRGDLAAERGTLLSVQAHLAFLGFELGFDPVAFGRLLLGLCGLESEPAQDAELEDDLDP